MTPETKQEPYFFMKDQEVAKDLSTTKAGGYVGSRSSSMPGFAAILALLGGLLAIAGPMMQWITVTVGPLQLGKKVVGLVNPAAIGSDPLKGTAQWQGWVIVVCGVALVVLAAAYLLTKARVEGDVSRLRLAIVPAGLAVIATIWLFFLLASEATKVPEFPGVSAEVMDTIRAAITVTYASGAWVTAIGALLAIAGAVMAIMASAPKVTAIAPGGSKWMAPMATSPRPGGEHGAHSAKDARGSKTLTILKGGTSAELRVDTTGERVTDLSEQIAKFALGLGTSGVIHIFVQHATAGVAIMELESGSEADFSQFLDRLLPPDDRYVHSHGSVGHGRDHLVPIFISQSLSVPVDDGRLALGTWQSIVLIDPNADNDMRKIRLTLLPGVAAGGTGLSP